MKIPVLCFVILLICNLAGAQDQFTNTGNLQSFPGASIAFFGNFVNDGAFTDNGSMVTFSGSASQSISGTSITTFKNVVENSGAIVVSLQQDMIISNSLVLTSGQFNLNSKTLTIANNASAAISRTSGYILSDQVNNSGKIKWNIGTDASPHIFPFGTASSVYIPFTLQVTAGDIGNVTVSTYPTAANNTPYPTTPTAVTNVDRAGVDNSANVVDRFWQIDKDGPSGTASIIFSAAPSEVGSISSLQAQRWNSSTGFWEDPLSGQVSASTSVTVSGITTFSPWTLSGNSLPLPIELLTFTAEAQGYDVNLNWKTATEINNDYFTVQRSKDGMEFFDIAKVRAGMDGKTIQKYNYVDSEALPGRSYYRLKQTDLDGTFGFSEVRKVDIDETSVVTVFPNPTITNEFSLDFHGELKNPTSVTVYDLVGKLVFSEIINPGITTYTINLVNSPAGMYVIKTLNTQASFLKVELK